MKLYKTTILPMSNFATTLKGDTLFGQLCWSIRYALGEERLEALLEGYESRPFLIVSDGFPTGYLPKPKMPSSLLGEDSNDKKANRKKIWLTLAQLSAGEFTKALTDKEVKNGDKTTVMMHNSINYKSFKTSDDGAFSPYGEKELFLTQKDVYFLIDDTQISVEELKKAFAHLSLSGYGKDTTIGKGRFDFEEFEEVILDASSTTYMTLSPFSPQDMELKSFYYESFTRFGKHGAALAHKNPFKKPLILADSGAVVEFEKAQDLDFIGKAVKGHSVYEKTVHQGYSIVVPIKELT